MRIKGTVKNKWADEAGADIWEKHRDAYLKSKLLAHSSIVIPIIKKANQESRILEFGCGSGTYSIYLASLGYRVTASDFQPSALELTKERARSRLSEREQKNLDFKIIDAQNMDTPDQSYDLVYNVGAIEHLDIGKVLEESYRVLKKGGWLISIVPFDSIRWNVLWFLSAWINKGNVYTQLLTKKEWKERYETFFHHVDIKTTSFFIEALLMRMIGPSMIYRKIVPRILNTDILVLGQKK